jgi:16S rRNA (uracil1498-N3)-methyltransferase
MQRFYFDIPLKEKISIDDKDFFHQISHVLRSRIGDKVNIFNWDSYEYIYSISWITKKWIELEYVSKELNKADPEISISLYQAIPNKFEKIDYIVQKWVEVWIREFIFFKSERSSKLVISENKVSRYENIIKEALEQCWWNKQTRISFTDKIKIEDIKWEILVCDTKWTKSSVSDIMEDKKNINIFVWPEGWFSDTELEAFKNKWFRFINFWCRILRTETVSSVLAFKILN